MDGQPDFAAMLAQLDDSSIPLPQRQRMAQQLLAEVLAQAGVKSVSELGRIGGPPCTPDLSAACRQYFAGKRGQSGRV